MRKLVIVIALLAAVGLAAPVAQAAPILSLVELGFKTSNDGVAYDAYPSVLPDLYGDYSAFSFATGLGSISFTFSGEGDHYVAGFFDYQITDVFNNNGFFDEQAFWGGGPPAGWSAKSDDPWALESTPAPPNGGLPIYQQFTLFDGSNPFDNWAWISPGHDVSVALGYAFHLGAGDPARKVTFRVSDPRAARLLSPPDGSVVRHVDLLLGQFRRCRREPGSGARVGNPARSGPDRRRADTPSSNLNWRAVSILARLCSPGWPGHCARPAFRVCEARRGATGRSWE